MCSSAKFESRASNQDVTCVHIDNCYGPSQWFVISQNIGEVQNTFLDQSIQKIYLFYFEKGSTGPSSMRVQVCIDMMV